MSVHIYLCLLCDSRGPLLRLKPTKWYACKHCVGKEGGIEPTLVAAVDRLKILCLEKDPRMNNPALLAQVKLLSTELRARWAGDGQTVPVGQLDNIS